MARAKTPTVRPEAMVLGQNQPQHFAYPHTVADRAAIRAIANGRASEDQQIRGMQWIINVACMTYDETFDVGSERASAFMQGRRYVGLKLVLLTKKEPATPSETGA